MSQIEYLSQAMPVSMADEWFDVATEDHFWMQWRHCVLLQELKRANGPLHKMLEIGCGHGVARQMLERDLAISVDGCDLNLPALKMADPGKGQLFLYNIFDQEPAMLESYDAILLLDVIEHIEDDTAFLSAAIRHLRPGGLVVINVPANKSLFSKYDEAAGHVRRYNTNELADLFHRCEVEAGRFRPWGLPMIPLLLLRKIILATQHGPSTIRTGFVPPNRLAELFMKILKGIETTLPFRMPFGTSLLAVGRRRVAPDA